MTGKDSLCSFLKLFHAHRVVLLLFVLHEFDHTIEGNSNNQHSQEDIQLGTDAKVITVSERNHKPQRFPQAVVGKRGLLVRWEQIAVEC